MATTIFFRSVMSVFSKFTYDSKERQVFWRDFEKERANLIPVSHLKYLCVCVYVFMHVCVCVCE